MRKQAAPDARAPLASTSSSSPSEQEQEQARRTQQEQEQARRTKQEAPTQAATSQDFGDASQYQELNPIGEGNVVKLRQLKGKSHV